MATSTMAFQSSAKGIRRGRLFSDAKKTSTKNVPMGAALHHGKSLACTFYFVPSWSNRLSGTKLNCGVHDCPQRCHQLHDHSKVPCEIIVKSTCSKNHKLSWKCFKKRPAICPKCDAEAREQEKRRQRDHKLETDREASQEAYAKKLADIQNEIEHYRLVMKYQSDDQERQRVLSQHKQDLANTKAAASRMNLKPTKTDPNAPLAHGEKPATRMPNNSNISDIPPGTKQNSDGSTNSVNSSQDEWKPPPSKKDWEYQKEFEGAENSALDSLVDMIGLEDVKQQFLSIKAKVDTLVRQNIPLKGERFNVAMLGNPGTGMIISVMLICSLTETLKERQPWLASMRNFWQISVPYLAAVS